MKSLQNLIKFVKKIIALESLFLFIQLLDKNKFSCVEKIKTIGSTYMAAAGLNPGAEHRMVVFFKSFFFRHIFDLDKRTL